MPIAGTSKQGHSVAAKTALAVGPSGNGLVSGVDAGDEFEAVPSARAAEVDGATLGDGRSTITAGACQMKRKCYTQQWNNQYWHAVERPILACSGGSTTAQCGNLVIWPLCHWILARRVHITGLPQKRSGSVMCP